MSNVGEWKFDDEVKEIFDSHVRMHVPNYDDIHKMISDMSVWFVEDNTNIYDIGTSTGEVISNISKTNRQKNANYYGYDISESMVEETSKRFENDKNIFISNCDARDMVIDNASLIVSFLTLQFISIKDRQSIIDNIYNSLNVGGAFILVEKIQGNNAFTDRMWRELYHDKKIEQGVTEKELVDKDRAIRGVLKPLTLNENISMIESSGFEYIDIFHKWNSFVGIIAIK